MIYPIISFVKHLGNLVQLLFVVGLFVSVFVFWPNSDVAYELPKVWFVNRWIEILSIVSFIGLAKLQKEKLDSLLIIFIILFLLTSIISSIIGVDLRHSIVGNYYRADGLITLIHYILLFFVLILFFDKYWIKNFARVISISTLILSVISIFQFVGNLTGVSLIETWEGGYGHVFGNPNFLVGYLIVTLPITTYFADYPGKLNILGKSGLLLQVIGILLTNAWVGYFGIALFLVTWLFIKIKKARLIIILIGLLTIGSLVFVFNNYQKSLETPISINPESRQRIFMKSILAFQQKPIFGFGWANFDKAFESVDWPIHMNQDVYVDKAHSSLLEVMTTTGLIGITVYMFIIIKTLLNLAHKKDLIYKYLLGVFILLVLHMQTNVISVSEEILFWIVAAFSAKET